MKRANSRSVSITIPGVGPVLLERSRRAHYLSISVKPFKDARVAVPDGVSLATAEQFARSQADWLAARLQRIRKLERVYQAISGDQVDREEARRVLTARLEELARRHGYRYNRASIRNQKTRWGSCSGRNNISLNQKLLLLPADLRDLIIIHELVHTRIKHHGQAFWRELTRIEPRARELTRRLQRFVLR